MPTLHRATLLCSADEMPFTVSIDHEARYLRFTGRAPFMFADAELAIQTRITEGWSYRTLIDLSAVGSWLPTKGEVQLYAQRTAAVDKTHGRRGPVAFVVAQEQPALYGMLRMYSAFLEMNQTARVEVFYARDDAERWLRAAT